MTTTLDFERCSIFPMKFYAETMFNWSNSQSYLRILFKLRGHVNSCSRYLARKTTGSHHSYFYTSLLWKYLLFTPMFFFITDSIFVYTPCAIVSQSGITWWAKPCAGTEYTLLSLYYISTPGTRLLKYWRLHYFYWAVGLGLHLLTSYELFLSYGVPVLIHFTLTYIIHFNYVWDRRSWVMGMSMHDGSLFI